jgi:hypothetical protein
MQDAFTSRFEKEVRSRGTVARDKLFSRKICMNSSVQEYINDFRQQILHIPDMHEEDKIRFFHTGLTPQLRIDCVCTNDGTDFTSLVPS